MSQFGLIPETDDEVIEAEPSARPRRRRRRHSSWLAVIVSVAVIGGLGAAVAIAGQGLLSRAGDLISSGPEDYPGPGPGTTVPIVVAEGDSAADIALTLTAADVVASAEAFVDVAARDAASTGIQPGTYAMPQQIPAADALAILVDPANRIADAVLVREGLRVEQTVDAFVQQGSIPRKQLNKALTRPKAIGLPKEASGEPEGFLFPATYEVLPSTTAVQALSAMTAKYDEVAESLDLDAKAKELGYTPREIV